MGNLNFLVEQISKEKGIDREIIIEALKEAMVKAAQKRFGIENADSIEAMYNDEEGEVELYQFKVVVKTVEDPDFEITLEEAQQLDDGSELGDELGIKLDNSQFGRIAAQVAKQIIVNKMRTAEREIVYNDYKDRKGDLIAGTVRRIERGNIIIDLGRAEGILLAKDQSPRETYRVRDRLLAYVKDVSKSSRGPQILLSRTDDGLLIKLFEMEVPEIAEGIVSITSAAREPGSRSKIAVQSRDPDVDPVGACVGMKGTRVQNIVQELRGEKIDIVPWNPDPVKFVCNGLAPAIVSQVLIDEDERVMEITVPDDQLSLAIGKKGQNVRLAAQLTGWKLDIQSESRVERMSEIARDLFSNIAGVDEELAHTLTRLGFMSLDDIISTQVEDLEIIPGLNRDSAYELIEAAQRHKQFMKEEDARRREEIERRKQKQRERQASIPSPDTLSHELLRVRNVDEDILESLRSMGYDTILDLARIKEEDIKSFAEQLGMGMRSARGIIHSARQKLPKVHPELFEDGKPPVGVDMPWYKPEQPKEPTDLESAFKDLPASADDDEDSQETESH